MPSGVYPEFKDKKQTKPHPAAGLSVNKYKANGELRPARKSRAKEPTVKHIPVADKKFKSAELLDSDDEPVVKETAPVVVKTKKLVKKYKLKMKSSGLPPSEHKALYGSLANGPTVARIPASPIPLTIEEQYKGQPLPDFAIQTEIGFSTEGFNRATADDPTANVLTWDGRGRYDYPALIDASSRYAQKDIDKGQAPIEHSHNLRMGAYDDQGYLGGIGGILPVNAEEESYDHTKEELKDYQLKLADEYVYRMAFGDLKDKRNDPILQQLQTGHPVELTFGGEDMRTPMLKHAVNTLPTIDAKMGELAKYKNVNTREPQLGVQFAQAILPIEKHKHEHYAQGKKTSKAVLMGKRYWAGKDGGGWQYEPDFLAFQPKSYMTYKEGDMFKGRGGVIGMPKFDDKGNLLIYGRAKRNLPIPSNQSSQQLSGITTSGVPAGLTEAGWDKTKVVYADTGQPVFERNVRGKQWLRNPPLGGYISGIKHGEPEDYDYMERDGGGHFGDMPYYRQFVVGSNRHYPSHISTNHRQDKLDKM